DLHQVARLLLGGIGAHRALDEGALRHRREQATESLLSGRRCRKQEAKRRAELHAPSLRAVPRCQSISRDLADAGGCVRSDGEKTDARCQVARSRLDLTDALAARGNKSAALAELDAARDVFSQMEAPGLIERASRAAAAFSQQAPVQRPPSPAQEPIAASSRRDGTPRSAPPADSVPPTWTRGAAELVPSRSARTVASPRRWASVVSSDSASGAVSTSCR